jgi:hypothetical protein
VIIYCMRPTRAFRSEAERCASTEDHQAPSLPLFREQGTSTGVMPPLQTSSQKLPRLSHTPLDIRLQMPRSCLPIIPRVADAVGAEDEFV